MIIINKLTEIVFEVVSLHTTKQTIQYAESFKGRTETFKYENAATLNISVFLLETVASSGLVKFKLYCNYLQLNFCLIILYFPN